MYIYIQIFLKNEDIMHNEELGLLKKEIMLMYEGMSKASKKLLNQRILQMPKVANFPKVYK